MNARNKRRWSDLYGEAEVQEDPRKLKKLAEQIVRILDAEYALAIRWFTYQADLSHQDNRDRSCDIGALSQTIAVFSSRTARSENDWRSKVAVSTGNSRGPYVFSRREGQLTVCWMRKPMISLPHLSQLVSYERLLQCAQDRSWSWPQFGQVVETLIGRQGRTHRVENAIR
jgi:hypothetical protein